METHPGEELVHRFFPGTGATYDYMVNFCTVGFDRWWKRKILEKIPQRSLRIIDQACGTGILTFKIAHKFPLCRVIGVELREEYLKIAKEKATDLNLSNVEFILGRAEDVMLDESFDCITSSYLVKYAELGSLIRNAKKMLGEKGLLIMHDFTYPAGRVFAQIWDFYFKLLQTVGGRRYPQWRTIFHELPVLLRNTRWVNELVKTLQENAFSDISLESLTLGTSTIVTARKK
jgi:demethylmenaquinone methyltransferase/2-methoxy-6-polyprenyl-1,4-benzoquinol methylase